MAGGQERVLRRRIKSIQSTQKITRAQELIAASRIVKATAAVEAAQPYSESITQVVRDLAAGGGGSDSPLLTPRPEIRRVAFIVIAADRGLSGAYNSSVIREAERAVLAEVARGRDYSVIAVGRKVESYFRYRDYKIDAVCSGFSDQPSYEDARQVGAAATSAFLAGDTDEVQIVYTEYRSAGVQAVVRQTLMPLVRDEIPEATGDAPTVAASYEFEPDPEGILDLLLPRYVDSRVYAALLNAAASEHTARQRAMKAATDNAADLITSLSRVMNRARQDTITTEIMEIVSGSEALRQGASDETDYLSDTIEGRERGSLRRTRHRPLRLSHRSHSMTMTADTPETTLKDGRVVAIAGPVVDVEFPPDALPEINFARRDGRRARGRHHHHHRRGRAADRRQPRARHLHEAHRRPQARHDRAQHRPRHHHAGR